MDLAEKYLMLMFAIKRKGKLIDFDHVREKAERDLKIDGMSVKKILNTLIDRKIIVEEKGLYRISDEGRSFFSSKFYEWRNDLIRVNKTWTVVYEAINYYDKVADIVLRYCKGRHVGFYCTFTEQHFFRRQFKGRYITIDSKDELMRFVQMFCIDIIPCVHKIGADKPDWLVIDLDAGSKVSFDQVKEVAKVCYEVMEKLKLKPVMKFSGSRGIQLWSMPKQFDLPAEWSPLPMLRERRKRNYFSLFVDLVRLIQYKVDQELPGITTSIVCKKEEREDKILIDWSCLKPNGLVRSPYGIHHKTGLVSLPLSPKELEDFSLEDAQPRKVLERIERRGDEFRLEECDPSLALKELLDLKDVLSSG
ncbi:MAG TPA: hypothetical protein ENF40_00895 [Thermoplasmatales archaeon]|nr:hypothetical protein [Thermoplasmatales archaeon]